MKMFFFIALLVIAAVLATGVITTILMIGKPRRMITPAFAALDVVISGAVVTVLVLAALYIRR